MKVKVGDSVELNFNAKLIRKNGFRAKRGWVGVQEMEIIKISSFSVTVLAGNNKGLVIPKKLFKVLLVK